DRDRNLADGARPVVGIVGFEEAPRDLGEIVRVPVRRGGECQCRRVERMEHALLDEVGSRVVDGRCRGHGERDHRQAEYHRDGAAPVDRKRAEPLGETLPLLSCSGQYAPPPILTRTAHSPLHRGVWGYGALRRRCRCLVPALPRPQASSVAYAGARTLQATQFTTIGIWKLNRNDSNLRVLRELIE